MEVVSLVVQSCIGLIFAIYGVCLLLSNRKKEKRMKSKIQHIHLELDLSYHENHSQ